MDNTTELSSFIDTSSISSEDAALINKNIDSLIERCKGNQQEVNRLVFESVAAMTAGDEAEHKLSNKRGIRRFWGSITGSNKKLQDQINQNRALAQYASQQTLQKLAEQNMMSFDLIAAVNNKLNASMVAVEAEFSQVYDYLGRFFKKTRSDMVQLESRVERLERNVNLLNWQNSIEYQMFNGVEYSELDNPAKMVCLARDFYEITKGNWTTSDLLLLRTAMGTIDISPKTSVNYFELIKQISSSPVLKARLLGNKRIIRTPDAGYLTMMGGIKKLELLQNQEAYIVDTVAGQVNAETPRETIEENLTQSYLTQETQMDVNCNVPAYELLLEMIYNIRQAEDEGLLGEKIDDEFLPGTNFSQYSPSENNLDVIFQKASDLFRTYHPQEALPLLQELSDTGYSRANALLYWLYDDGYYDNKKLIMDGTLAEKYLTKGMQAGDCICYVLYYTDYEDADDPSLYECYLAQVKELASHGDIYAEYTLGWVKFDFDDDEDKNTSAVEHFKKSNKQGFYKAADSIFLMYYYGSAPFPRDWNQGTIWGEKVIKYGCPSHIFNVANMYMTIKDYGCSQKTDQMECYQRAISLWSSLLNQGSGSAATNLGWMYENEFVCFRRKGYSSSFTFAYYQLDKDAIKVNKELALKYYKIAAEMGDSIGQENLDILSKASSKEADGYRIYTDDGNSIVKQTHNQTEMEI